MRERKNNSSKKIVYLSLGSNINPSKNIIIAIEQLSIRFNNIICSSIWESASMDNSGPDFLNAVVKITTEFPQKELKIRLREIEADMGRVRSKNKNAPRPIDIDILIYNNKVLDPDIWTQAYLAIPLAEVYPFLVNRDTGENIRIIAKLLHDQYEIKSRDDLF